jgi:hypothetical protein
MWGFKLLCVFQYILIHTIFLSNGFIKFKVDDSIHVYMLILQELWKNSFNHSNIIRKNWIILGIWIHYNKCNMWHDNTSFNILKVNGCIHEHILWRTPKLFDGFNCESKGEDNKRKRCWGVLEFRDGTRKINKQVQLFTWICTNQTLSWLVCSWSTLVHVGAQMDHK